MFRVNQAYIEQDTAIQILGRDVWIAGHICPDFYMFLTGKFWSF